MKSTKGANGILMLLNSNLLKAWTLNIVAYQVPCWSKICKEKFKILSSVQLTTSIIKDFNKYKNPNKNALPSIFSMIQIKHKLITQLQQKKSLKKLKKLLIWVKHFPDNLSKIYKIKPLLQSKIHFIIMYPVISKKVKKANLSISIKS